MALQCRTCGSIIYNKMPKNLFHIENEKMLQDINLVTGTTVCKKNGFHLICAAFSVIAAPQRSRAAQQHMRLLHA